MIIYKFEDRWTKFIYFQFRSQSFKRTYKIMFYALLYGGAIKLLQQFVDIPVVDSGNLFSLLGGLYTLLIIFKTNQSYNRWWEARKLWGSLVNHCRNYAINLHSCLPTNAGNDRKSYAELISLYPEALSVHLRRGDRGSVEKAIEPYNLEHRDVNNLDHMPNYIASVLYQQMQSNLRNDFFSRAELRNLKTHHQALTDILGGCERILKTPLPFAYQAYIKLVMIIFAVALPFALFSTPSWFILVFYVFIIGVISSLDIMAEEIEDPFGGNENDLPLDSMAATIRYNVFEIFNLAKGLERPAPPELYKNVI